MPPTTPRYTRYTPLQVHRVQRTASCTRARVWNTFLSRARFVYVFRLDDRNAFKSENQCYTLSDKRIFIRESLQSRNVYTSSRIVLTNFVCKHTVHYCNRYFCLHVDRTKIPLQLVFRVRPPRTPAIEFSSDRTVSKFNSIDSKKHNTNRTKC